jgi:hypothetical protein
LAKSEHREQAEIGAGANAARRLRPQPGSAVALSVKQPWAALLVLGLKTVEVRTWPTRRRGRVFIHAAKNPDDRPEGWALLTTPELRALANLRGGLIGVGELIDCVEYATAETFVADAHRHRNAAEWFRPGGLHGFVFADVRLIPFRECAGQTFFFGVESSLPDPT